MNDYLSVRGTRDFARVSPEELNRVQIARNGYHRKKRSADTQIGTMISRYLCDGLKSKCWDCECRVQCEYGKRYMALLRQREADAGRPSDKLENACLGLAGETGEVCDVLKKYLFQGHELDRAHMIEELGDCAWYLAEAASGLGVSLEDILLQNIAKLKRRYPAGFDPERSVHREAGA